MCVIRKNKDSVFTTFKNSKNKEEKSVLQDPEKILKSFSFYIFSVIYAVFCPRNLPTKLQFYLSFEQRLLGNKIYKTREMNEIKHMAEQNE